MTIGILDHVWSGSFELENPENMSPIAGMFSSLLAAPILCFVSDVSDSKLTPGAWVAGEEVYPGASLADILCEEFDIEITDETIVYVEPSEMRDIEALSNEAVKEAISNVLISLAKPNVWGIPGVTDVTDPLASLGSDAARGRRSLQELLQ